MSNNCLPLGRHAKLLLFELACQSPKAGTGKPNVSRSGVRHSNANPNNMVPRRQIWDCAIPAWAADLIRPTSSATQAGPSTRGVTETRENRPKLLSVSEKQLTLTSWIFFENARLKLTCRPKGMWTGCFSSQFSKSLVCS